MPKLALRDLFAVVTIVALALGWWLDRSRLAEQRDTARRESEFQGFQADTMQAALEQGGSEVTVTSTGAHVSLPDGRFFGRAWQRDQPAP
jgi:hypothetical protein